MAPRRQRGFTLIEVVVAFVMLTLVLMTSIEIFTSGFRRAADLEDYSRAIVLAQSHLAAAGVEESFKEGERRGETEDRRFQWAVAITRSDEGGPEPGQPPQSAYQLFRVDVRVDWRGGDGRPHSISLATLGLGSRI